MTRAFASHEARSRDEWDSCSGQFAEVLFVLLCQRVCQWEGFVVTRVATETFLRVAEMSTVLSNNQHLAPRHFALNPCQMTSCASNDATISLRNGASTDIHRKCACMFVRACMHARVRVWCGMVMALVIVMVMAPVIMMKVMVTVMVTVMVLVVVMVVVIW